jgi:hypothetical protein
VSVDFHFRKSLMFEPFSELLEVFGTHFIHLRLFVGKEKYISLLFIIV